MNIRGECDKPFLDKRLNNGAAPSPDGDDILEDEEEEFFTL